jgi:hypothetical protein
VGVFLQPGLHVHETGFPVTHALRHSPSSLLPTVSGMIDLLVQMRSDLTELLKRNPRCVCFDTFKLSLTEFFGDQIPSRYAILSHTWQTEEITFQELQEGKNRHKHGWTMVEKFCALGWIHAAHRNVTPTGNSLQKCVHLPPEMMGSYLALETKLSLWFTSVSSEYRFTCALNHSAKRGFPDLESTTPKPQPSLRR